MGRSGAYIVIYFLLLGEPKPPGNYSLVTPRLSMKLLASKFASLLDQVDFRHEEVLLLLTCWLESLHVGWRH